MMTLSFIIRSETLFLNFSDINSKLSLTDWTSIIVELPNTTAVLFSITVCLMICANFAFIAVMKKTGIISIILQRILYPLLHILLAKLIANLVDESLSKDGRISVWMLVAMMTLTILTTILYTIRNLYLTQRFYTSNVLNYLLVDGRYFALEEARFMVGVYGSIVMNPVLMAAILGLMGLWKAYMLSRDLVYEECALEWFDWYGTLYGGFAVIKLLVLSLMIQYQLSIQDIAYTPLIFSSIVISIILCSATFPCAPTMFTFQQVKYKQMIEEHLNPSARLTQGSSKVCPLQYFKTKLLISNLLLQRSSCRKGYDLCLEMGLEINYLLEKYLKREYERLNNIIKKGKGQIENDSSSEGSHTLKKHRGNLIFHQPLNSNIINNTNHSLLNQTPTPTLALLQPQTQQLSLLKHPQPDTPPQQIHQSNTSENTCLEQFNRTYQSYEAYVQDRNLKQVEEIMTHEQSQANRECLAMVVTEKVLTEKKLEVLTNEVLGLGDNDDTDNLNTSNPGSSVTKLTGSIQHEPYPSEPHNTDPQPANSLWKVLLSQLQPTNKSHLLIPSSVSPILHRLYLVISLLLIKTSATPVSVSNAIYLFHRAKTYLNFQTDQVQQVQSSSRGRSRMSWLGKVLEYFERVSSETILNSIVEKIGHQRSIQGKIRYQRTVKRNDISLTNNPAVVHNFPSQTPSQPNSVQPPTSIPPQNPSCLSLNTTTPSAFYQPCYRQFMSCHLHLTQLTSILQDYFHFMSHNSILLQPPTITPQLHTFMLSYYHQSSKIKEKIFQLLAQPKPTRHYFPLQFKAVEMCFQLMRENRVCGKYAQSEGKVKEGQGTGRKVIVGSNVRDIVVDKNKVMYQNNIESLLVEQTGKECLVVCSGFNDVGSIITMSNSFSQLFLSQPQDTNNQPNQTHSNNVPNQRSSINLHLTTPNHIQVSPNPSIAPHKTPNPLSHYTSTISPYPKLSTSIPATYHLNNLILLPFQQRHFRHFNPKNLLQSINHHNLTNPNDHHTKGLYCTDVKQGRHYQVDSVEIYITVSMSDDVYMVIKLSQVKELQYLEVEEKLDKNGKGFNMLTTSLSHKVIDKPPQNLLLYKYVHPERLMVFKNHIIASAQPNQLSINTNNHKSHSSESEQNNSHQLILQTKLPFKTLSSCLKDVEVIYHKNYLSKSIIVTKSFLTPQHHSTNPIHQPHTHQLIQPHQRMDHVIHYHQILYKTQQLQTVRKLITGETPSPSSIKLTNLILFKSIFKNLLVMFILIAVIGFIFISSYAVSHNLKHSAQQFLNLRKITHTDFILNQVFSPIDLIVAKRIFKAFKLRHINMGQKKRYLAQINISSSLTMEFFRQAQRQLSIYDQQNTKTFYNLLYQSYLPSDLNNPSFSQNKPSSTSITLQNPSQQSFYLTYITQIHIFQQMITTMFANESNTNINQLIDRYEKSSLDSVKNFYENSHWHEMIDLYFNDWKVNNERINLMSMVLMNCLLVMAIIGIFRCFYDVKKIIYQFILIPLELGEVVRAKTRLKLEHLKTIIQSLSSSSNELIKRLTPQKDTVIEPQIKTPSKDLQTPPPQPIIFLKQSKLQLFTYATIVLITVALCYRSLASRSELIQQIKTYEIGEEQFMEKLIYQFDMFKILITNYKYQGTGLGEQVNGLGSMIAEKSQKSQEKTLVSSAYVQQYLRSEEMYRSFNYPSMIQHLTNHDEFLKDKMLVQPLCSKFWQTMRWYGGCSNPFSPLLTNSYIQFASKATLMLKQLKHIEFNYVNQTHEVESMNLILKGYEQLWNIHKIGFEYLTISHKRTNQSIMQFNSGEFDIYMWFGGFIFVVVIVNLIVYARRFRVWQKEIFEIGQFTMLRNQSETYSRVINRIMANIRRA